VSSEHRAGPLRARQLLRGISVDAGQGRSSAINIDYRPAIGHEAPQRRGGGGGEDDASPTGSVERGVSVEQGVSVGDGASPTGSLAPIVVQASAEGLPHATISIPLTADAGMLPLAVASLQ
jgi:hypothetical protein